MSARVSVILLSYNNGAYIEDCLTHLMAQNFAGLEVICLDNASSDDSVELFRKFPVTVIENGENLGGCEGINVGMRAATGQYVLLLDIDTRIQPGAIQKLYDYMESHADVGVVQGRLMLGATNTINSCGNAMNVVGHTWCVGLNEDYRGQYPNRKLSNASGACFFMRASAMREVGYYDKEMFLYNEDADLSLRFLLYGYDLAYLDEAVVEHHYSVSVNTRMKYYFLERNRWIILWKNYSWMTLFKLSPLLVFQELGILAFAAQKGFFVDKLKGYWWFFKQIPVTLHKREKIQRERRVSDRELMAVLERSFGYADIQNFLIQKILNPVMKNYCQWVFGGVKELA